jgi:hypothetical protein
MQNLGNGRFVMSRTDAQNVLDMVFKDIGREGEHRGKTSAHAPNYENMAGNLNNNF